MADFFDMLSNNDMGLTGFSTGLDKLFGANPDLGDWRDNTIQDYGQSGDSTFGFQRLDPNWVQSLQAQGYGINQRGGEGGGSWLDLMQNGNMLGSYQNSKPSGFLDNLMYGGGALAVPFLPTMFMGAPGAAGGAAGGATASAVAPQSLATIGQMSTAPLIDMGSIASVNSLPAIGGSGALAGLEALPSSMTSASSLPTVGQMSTAPAIDMSSIASVPSIPGMGDVGATGAGSREKAAMYSNEGYGAGMSGADTGFFDSLLGMGASPNFAAGATNLASPIMNNPVMDQLRRLKEMMGQKVVGNLSGGDLLRGAMTYNNYRQNSKAMKSQQKSLEGLYGQNSPYSQALRQQLERRDAAAGRRSQYGPREVELQAALAGNAARLAPSLQQLMMERNNMRNQGYRTAGQFLNKGLGNTFLSGLFGG